MAETKMELVVEEPPKAEKDFTSEVEALIPKVTQLAKGGQIQQALEQLLVVEKQTRSASDTLSNARVVVCIVQLCFQQNEWKLLQDHVTLLSKKHGLLKQAIVKMVQEAMLYVDKTPDMATKLQLIDTLRLVTEGKIYVEIERARLTRQLASIREKEGKIKEAADVLQELQVETFGSMDKCEKTEFILEQMRLSLLNNDDIRFQIIAKKISPKFFDKESDVELLKLKFYELMIEQALHDDDYLNICKHYRNIYNTASITSDDAKWQSTLQLIVVFIVLAPFNHEQFDLIHRISLEEKLDKLPVYKQLLKLFTTSELMRWPKIEEMFGTLLRALAVFDAKHVDGAKHWDHLHRRVIEHNIRVVAKYYRRITIKRLTTLLDLPAEKTETFLSDLVVSKTIYAKVDRLDGIVVFHRPQKPDEILYDWSQSINSLLDLIAKTTHLISKEEMVNKITQTSI